MKLNIIAFTILVLTFVFREIFKDWLKALQDGISSAESLCHTELSLSNLQTQLAQLEIDLKAPDTKQLVRQAKRTNNFSKVIRKDVVALRKRRNELRQMEQQTARLLKPFPPNARALRKQFLQLRRNVETVIAASLETEKSLAGNAWSHSALVKIKIMELALQEIEIAVFEDHLLTQAVKIRDAAEKLYKLCNLIGYALYLLGISLAFYANLKGIKHLTGLD